MRKSLVVLALFAALAACSDDEAPAEQAARPTAPAAPAPVAAASPSAVEPARAQRSTAVPARYRDGADDHVAEPASSAAASRKAKSGGLCPL